MKIENAVKSPLLLINGFMLRNHDDSILIKIAFLVAILTLGGCAGLQSLEKSAKLEGNESVFILGVKPDRFRVAIFPGEIQNGKFQQSGIKNGVAYSFPEDGYLIAKAPAGETLAITLVRAYAKRGDVLGSAYGPCGGKYGFTFHVPAGKVIYLTDIEFSDYGGALHSKYNENLAAAQKYIDANYPALKDKVELWPYEFQTNSSLCNKDITVYIAR